METPGRFRENQPKTVRDATSSHSSLTSAVLPSALPFVAFFPRILCFFLCLISQVFFRVRLPCCFLCLLALQVFFACFQCAPCLMYGFAPLLCRFLSCLLSASYLSTLFAWFLCPLSLRAFSLQPCVFAYFQNTNTHTHTHLLTS